MSLSALSKIVAHTSASRLDVLKTRDNIVRLGLGSTKRSDLATAQVIRGTCPDMCPEIERYMREEQRRLSIYEMVSGTEMVSSFLQANITL